MYNRYIPGAAGYTRIPEEDTPPHTAQAETPPDDSGQSKAASEKTASKLSDLLKKLKLEHLDTGDLLLLLILLLLLLEGDDWELIITLGLLLLFGLEDTSS